MHFPCCISVVSFDTRISHQTKYIFCLPLHHLSKNWRSSPQQHWCLNWSMFTPNPLAPEGIITANPPHPPPSKGWAGCPLGSKVKLSKPEWLNATECPTRWHICDYFWFVCVFVLLLSESIYQLLSAAERLKTEKLAFRHKPSRIHLSAVRLSVKAFVAFSLYLFAWCIDWVTSLKWPPAAAQLIRLVNTRKRKSYTCILGRWLCFSEMIHHLLVLKSPLVGDSSETGKVTFRGIQVRPT